MYVFLPNGMVKITFELNDKLDERFRKAVAESKGLHKGVLGEAIAEALETWIEKEANRRISETRKKKEE